MYTKFLANKLSIYKLATINITMVENRSMNKIFNRLGLFISLLLFPVIGLFMLLVILKAPNVNYNNDLTLIKGRIKDYSFTYESSGRGMSRKFYIWVDGYKSKFQIKAAFLPYFYQTKFEQDLAIGDSIEIAIPIEQYKDIFLGKKVLAYSIESNSRNYLASKDTIADNDETIGLYFGIAFIIIGVCLAYYKLKSKF